jgi:hypothetical protein
MATSLTATALTRDGFEGLATLETIKLADEKRRLA